MIPRPNRFIDYRMPLSWIITTAVTLILTFGAFFTKLDTISSQLNKMEIRNDKRDDSIQLIINAMSEIKTINSLQSEAIDRNKSDILDLKNDVSELRKGVNGKN